MFTFAMHPTEIDLAKKIFAETENLRSQVNRIKDFLDRQKKMQDAATGDTLKKQIKGLCGIKSSRADKAIHGSIFTGRDQLTNSYSPAAEETQNPWGIRS